MSLPVGLSTLNKNPCWNLYPETAQPKTELFLELTPACTLESLLEFVGNSHQCSLTNQ